MFRQKLIRFDFIWTECFPQRKMHRLPPPSTPEVLTLPMESSDESVALAVCISDRNLWEIGCANTNRWVSEYMYMAHRIGTIIRLIPIK